MKKEILSVAVAFAIMPMSVFAGEEVVKTETSGGSVELVKTKTVTTEETTQTQSVATSDSSAKKMVVNQTQLTSDGKIEITLLSVKTRKNMMTITFKAKNISNTESSYGVKWKNVVYTDSNQMKAYHVFRRGGNYLTSSLGKGGYIHQRLKFDLKPGEEYLFWAKFPAPSESTKTIDLSLPGVMPFEDIKIRE